MFWLVSWCKVSTHQDLHLDMMKIHMYILFLTVDTEL